MNTLLIIANLLVLLTFVVHTFGGDKEYKIIEPDATKPKNLETWMMGRGAFHIVSADFLLATLCLALVNFTDYFGDKALILNILAIYFFLYGFGFLLALVVSKPFEKKYFKLWQWLLMFVISGLIYLGNH